MSGESGKNSATYSSSQISTTALTTPTAAPAMALPSPKNGSFVTVLSARAISKIAT